MRRTVAREGHSCWRRPVASRAALMIDGAEYFPAFAAAVARAQHSVQIACWDVHSRVRLFPDDTRPPGLEGYPAELGEFLAAVLERRPQLTVRVLEWDFVPLFAFERESSLFRKLGPSLHPRLHMHLDDQHPVGGTHHQKVVVVDDVVAFSGGLDITGARWDTREHRAHDPRRIDPDGGPYTPFHDAMMAVEGPAAAALGELFRERWYRGTGERLEPPPPRSPELASPWPPMLGDVLEHVPVGIARTLPAWSGSALVREVEQLYLDAIASARRTIYIENQYATCSRIARALAARLREPRGPEVVIVVPRECSGWVERATMGQARGRFMKILSETSSPRLHVYYAVSRGVTEDIPINVHSKVMAIDDVFLQVGSANLSNRSMSLDLECDLAIESEGKPLVAAWIARGRDGLVAEHLGVEASVVTAETARRGSLGAAIEALRRDESRASTLLPLDCPDQAWSPVIMPAEALFDPDGEVAPEAMLDTVASKDGHSLTRVLVLAGVPIGLLILIYALDPFSGIIDAQQLQAWFAPWRNTVRGVLMAIGLYVLASLALVPVPVLTVTSFVVMGPALGLVCALSGSLGAAAAAHGLGRLLPESVIKRIGGARLEKTAEALRQRGLLAVMTARLVPVAPYTIVNLISGTVRIRLRDLLLGTFLVLGPGMFALSLGLHPIVAALERPGPWRLVLAALAIVALSLGFWWIRIRLLRRVHPPDRNGDEDGVPAHGSA